MAVSLSKGGNVSLSKEAPGLTKVLVGLGWDARATDGGDFDLDASAFLVNASGKVRGDGDFIFYNNLCGRDCKSPPGCTHTDGTCGVTHTGDNRTGAGDGDDEAIKIDLSKVPADVHRIAICVTIHDAEGRRQNFGMVSNAFVRVVNANGDKEVARYDLAEDASTETAMIFAEIYRNGEEWKFKAIGQGFAGGLGPLARNFGVSV